MRHQAFFFIETQFDNLGDALINRELINLAAAHAAVTLGVSKVPHSFRDMIGRSILSAQTCDETSGRSLFLLRILGRALRGERCFVFLSPGGWIGELDGRLNLRSWLHSALYHLLAFSGVKICQLGVSYEDLGPKLRLLLRGRSRAMYRHYVRDEGSRAEMAKIGVQLSGLCPDLAFNAFGPASQAANPKGVTFSFRTDQYPEQLEHAQQVIAAYLKACGTSDPIYFVSQVKKDIGGNEKLAEWTRKTYGLSCACDDGSVTIAATETLYRRTTVVVSNRLHSLLLAGSVGNAMVAAPLTEHNKKIFSLFADIGLTAHLFSAGDAIDDATLRRAAATLFDATEKKKEIAACVAEIFNATA